jgi:hypothetical protein
VAYGIGETEEAKQPTHGVLWPAGAYDGAHGGEEQGAERVLEPVVVDVGRVVGNQQEEPERRESHG